MSLSLAARYRPQTFAELVGQETVRFVLSRAAAEDRAAPAYLFSGTRGVGKTTTARIFAKALNCGKAPTPEPCNQCEQCRKITQGIHVDVPEIDGASNRGIEDARRLREHIGYAPLEARRKVFIIDEAHMLTRESFNALLKTLEEPPPRVTFILATTEAHKFPVTIVSRCQHFVFQLLPEAQIAAHIRSILERERIRCEDAAVRMLARRAAGSVRDAVSLTDQTLALGDAEMNAQAVRRVLGMAGREFFASLLERIAAGDCAAVSASARELQTQGVDTGFFLRELAALWRNLFLLRQAGETMLPVLDLPQEEGRELSAKARHFSLPHIHAAWQMTLDAQRRVIQSLEPACALELLLLNLALLPRLVPTAGVSSPMRDAGKTAAASEAHRDSGASPAPDGLESGNGTAPHFKEASSPAPEKLPDAAPDDRSSERPETHSDERRRNAPPSFLREQEQDAHARGSGENARNAELERFNFEAVEPLRTDFSENPRSETIARRTCFAAGQPFQGENALKEKFASHQLLQPLIHRFNARLIRCEPLNGRAQAFEEKGHEKYGGHPAPGAGDAE
jgi:DNA polymerase-3 subunit gamma/tau